MTRTLQASDTKYRARSLLLLLLVSGQYLSTVADTTTAASQQSQTTARVIHCDDIILGIGATGAYLAKLALKFPHWRICAIDIGKKVSDLTLPPYIPWPYSAPDAVRLYAGMYLVTGNVLNTIREYTLVNQPNLITIDPVTGQITPGRSPITAYARGVVGGGPQTNTAGDVVPAKRVINEDLNMPNFRWNEWQEDFEALETEIGINKVPIISALDPQIKLQARAAFEANGYIHNADMRDGKVLGSAGSTFCVVPSNPSNPFLLNRTSSGLRFVEDYEGKTPYPNLLVMSEMRADYADLRGWFNNAKGVWATNMTSGERIYLKRHRGEIFSCMGTEGDAAFLMRSGIYDGKKLREWHRPVRVDNKNVARQVWSQLNVRLLLSVNESLAITPKIPDFEIQSDMKGNGPMSADLSAKNSWSFAVSQLTVPIVPGRDTIALFQMQMYDIKSRGSITWSGPEYNATTFIDYGIFSDARDVQLARRMIPEAMRIVNHPAMKVAYPEVLLLSPHFNLSDPNLAELYARGSVNPTYHDGGTVPMGTFLNSKRVVDTRLRVVGAVNLRVASSAVFPVPLRANMASPCMALGRRLLRMIVQERRGNRWRRARYAGEFDDDDEQSTTYEHEVDEGTAESLAQMIALDGVETIAVPANYHNVDISEETEDD